MHKLIEFLQRVYLPVLFVVIELVAINYYAASTCYTEARMISQSNDFIGGVHGLFAGVRHYFSLGRENEMLLERMAELEKKLAMYQDEADVARFEEYVAEYGEHKFRTLSASVIANTINRAENFITLNRGTADGVETDMAVLSPDGSMVGYVIDCSEHYAIVMSVLNTSFRASGKLVGVDYFGSLCWDGRDPHVILLDELSKYAEPQVGDEVVTTSFSQYFPQDVKVGTVESVELNETHTAYTVRVKLSAEMSRLTNVLLIGNNDWELIRKMQQSPKVKQHIRQK